MSKKISSTIFSCELSGGGNAVNNVWISGPGVKKTKIIKYQDLIFSSISISGVFINMWICLAVLTKLPLLHNSLSKRQACYWPLSIFSKPFHIQKKKKKKSTNQTRLFLFWWWTCQDWRNDAHRARRRRKQRNQKFQAQFIFATFYLFFAPKSV